MGWLRTQIEMIKQRDPAARSALEIVLAYPGLHAVAFYQVSSRLRARELHTLARVVSHLGRFITGIEIHPGATIGQRLFIDHGMGVVIGETAIVGDDVTLYQGVTLGGTGKQKGRRHPTIGNNVVIGAGAKVLGDVTVGDGARVGGGAVVVKDVPPDTTAVGVPARSVSFDRSAGGADRALEQQPDPQRDTFLTLMQRIEELERRVRQLQETASEREVVGPPGRP
ncbi:MAG: serine O-acetyltransferase [Actinomycetota bacterium]|nr:serine O-acetyltransferase [Actinomycetota bacterium]